MMSKLEELIVSLKGLCPENGIRETSIPGVLVFRESTPHKMEKQFYESGIMFGAQGRKIFRLAGREYEFSPRHYMSLFMPMPVECELTEVSAEKPMLGLGFFFDQNRLAQLMLKMDRLMEPEPGLDEADPTVLYSGEVKDSLLDAVLRLACAASHPAEAAILADGLLDELYFRLLSEEKEGIFRHFLRQKGAIGQIARAVEYVHKNLERTVSVEEMASQVHMSASGFHRKFKDVMSLSPLQYAKSVKLSRARALLLAGIPVSEAGFRVGYQSPAQFSREYKRFFGDSPSARTRPEGESPAYSYQGG